MNVPVGYDLSGLAESVPQSENYEAFMGKETGEIEKSCTKAAAHEVISTISTAQERSVYSASESKGEAAADTYVEVHLITQEKVKPVSSSQTDFVSAEPPRFLDITEHADDKHLFLGSGEEVADIRHKKKLEARAAEDWRTSPTDVENTEPPFSDTHDYDTENFPSVDTKAEAVGIHHKDHLEILETVADSSPTDVVTTKAPRLLDSMVHPKKKRPLSGSKTKSHYIRYKGELQAVDWVADENTFNIDLFLFLFLFFPILSLLGLCFM